MAAGSVAWFVHLFLFRLHGDLFNHTAWLYVPILVMIWFKPPRANEGWAALTTLGWATAIVLVGTRLLEIVGVINIMYVPQWIIEFDKANYWLPLSGHLGLDGRWPGPFGHNGVTALMGAILVVLAVARWNRSSPIFLTVGALTLLHTGGRRLAGHRHRAHVHQDRSGGQDPGLDPHRGGMRRSGLGCVRHVRRRCGAHWPGHHLARVRGVVADVDLDRRRRHGHRGQRRHHRGVRPCAQPVHRRARPKRAAGVHGTARRSRIAVCILFRAAIRGLAGPLAIMAAYAITGVTEPRND